MKLQEAKSALYDEIAKFAKFNPDNHSYKNFRSKSPEFITEDDYAKIYWTLVLTNEIKEGPNAPPQLDKTNLVNFVQQRVAQLEKKKNKIEKEEARREFSGGGSGGRSSPKEDKTGLYNKYKVTNEEIPEDLKASLEDDDDIEISDDKQTAQDIFDDMNAYVCSIMQKRSTKPHLIINGAPGIGKCISPDTKIKIRIEDIIAEEFEAYLKSL